MKFLKTRFKNIAGSLHISRHKYGFVAAALLLVLLNACSPIAAVKKKYRQLSVAEKALVDSVLLYAFDHEALYTLADTLKPMSSMKWYRLPLLSENRLQSDSAVQHLKSLQQIVNTLNGGDWQFVLNPFERPDSIYKNVELYVVRKSRMASVIKQHSVFYGTLGITPHANPATVLAVTEYESKYNRWRSYGYLFGYPEHAVDFFVAAGKQQDSTRQFVKRDFFQIPVYAGTSGYFTYAVPQGYTPAEVDYNIYRKAALTLEQYSKLRQKYVRKTGVQATKIFFKYAKQ